MAEAMVGLGLGGAEVADVGRNPHGLHEAMQAGAGESPTWSDGQDKRLAAAMPMPSEPAGW